VKFENNFPQTQWLQELACFTLLNIFVRVHPQNNVVAKGFPFVHGNGEVLWENSSELAPPDKQERQAATKRTQ
jgi:HKD family nuclease